MGFRRAKTAGKVAYFAVLTRQDSTARWASSSEKAYIYSMQRQIALFPTSFFTFLNLRLHFVTSRIQVSDDAFLGKICLQPLSVGVEKLLNQILINSFPKQLLSIS